MAVHTPTSEAARALVGEKMFTNVNSGAVDSVDEVQDELAGDGLMTSSGSLRNKSHNQVLSRM
jgi:hypothetical protein